MYPVPNGTAWLRSRSMIPMLTEARGCAYFDEGMITLVQA